MRRYRNRPMSLADACLVRLSEIHASAEVLTLDSDFRIYRRHGNKVIPVRMPDPQRIISFSGPSTFEMRVPRS